MYPPILTALQKHKCKKYVAISNLKRTYHFTHYNHLNINLGLNYWSIDLERGLKEISGFSIHVFAFCFQWEKNLNLKASVSLPEWNLSPVTEVMITYNC